MLASLKYITYFSVGKTLVLFTSKNKNLIVNDHLGDQKYISSQCIKMKLKQTIFNLVRN